MHNAHRIELRTAERALRGMYVKGDSLTTEQVAMFFQYFEDLVLFYQLHLTFEEEVLFPLIRERIRDFKKQYGADQLSDNVEKYLKQLPAMDQHVQISLQLNGMKNYKDLVGKAEPSKIARSLIRAFRKLVVLDVKNLHEEETVCYNLLSKFGDAKKDQKYLDRELVKYHTKRIGLHKSFTVGMSQVYASQDAEHRDDMDDRFTQKWYEKFAARNADRVGRKRRDFVRPLLVVADESPHVMPVQ